MRVDQAKRMAKQIAADILERELSAGIASVVAEQEQLSDKDEALLVDAMRQLTWKLRYPGRPWEKTNQP
jgi:hypothetical protein